MTAEAARPRQPWGPALTLGPTVVVLTGCFYLCLAWTAWISFTRSRLLPDYALAGALQYERLLASPRWSTALSNLFVFGGLFTLLSLAIGTLLAVALDRQVRCESALRTAHLYPFSLSFIVAGVAWQWLLNPTLGLQKLVRDLGFSHFEADWITDPDTAIYTIVAAGVWRNAGLVMALMLAALRGVNPEIWRAARIDGIPTWRTYWHVVLPMTRPMVLTAVILLVTATITSYDLVVAMTDGGPGYATDMPGKFVVDVLFKRSNLGLASAAAVLMVGAVVAAIAPYLFIELRRRER